MWIDEQIWGHRLWDSTTPWLIFLEFLGVAEARDREGVLFAPAGSPYPLVFKPAQRMFARNLLYNNEALGRIAAEGLSDAASWEKWLPLMEKAAQGTTKGDFRYLKDRFASFRDFAALVGMLRSSTIENGANKRWSSRFVFPFGRHALYEDLNLKGTREYINFGLPGELLYQMLARSGLADQLKPHLEAAFDGDPCDKLMSLLEPPYSEDRQTRGNSYLPYAFHQSFEDVARDWLAVFEQRLPRFDAYPHLARLGALHLMRYQLDVAAETANMARPAFVCEIIASRRTPVRELSIASFQSNDALPQRAVEAYVASIGTSPDWQQALAGDAPFHDCRSIMVEKARWPGDDDYNGPQEPAELLASLRRAAVARHRQHVSNVHRSYGAGAGLVSRRATTQLRYAPTDGLLKTIILANIPLRMNYAEFLELIFERYGFVIGEREAGRVLGSDEFDKKSFQANSARLQRRLRTLGMLRRLSDACAYVENPLAKGTVR
jgi:hypothetical protein